MCFHPQRGKTCIDHRMAITQRNQSSVPGETTMLTNHTLRTTMPTAALIHLSSNDSNILLTSSKKSLYLFKFYLIIYKKKQEHFILTLAKTFNIFGCKT